MTTTVQRIVASCFVLVVAAAALAIPAHAQAQNRPRPAARPATRQLTNDEIRLYQLINQLNAQVAAQRAQAARAQAAAGSGRVAAGTPGTIGGFGSGTPNINPMTVLSNEADRIRRENGPLAQQIARVQGRLGQQDDCSIKLITGYYRCVRR